jgi:hypothetical protein
VSTYLCEGDGRINHNRDGGWIDIIRDDSVPEHLSKRCFDRLMSVGIAARTRIHQCVGVRVRVASES